MDASEPVPVAPTKVETEGLRVLLVWPDGRVSATLLALLADAGVMAEVAFNATEALAIAERQALTVVLAPPPDDGEARWLAPLREVMPALVVVALGDPGGPGAARARAAGAADVVDPRTLPPDALLRLLRRVIAHGHLERDHHQLLAERSRAEQAQALHARSLELLSTLEIEVLQELILKLFTELTGAQSAALWVQTQRGLLALRAHRGLLPRSALAALIDPLDGPLASRIEGSTPFIAAEAVPGSSPSDGLYIPLRAAAGTVGLLLLADKRHGSFAAGDLGQGRAIADVAGTALRNARRFHELERVGLRDRESPTYNVSYFIDYAGKELYKASRYGRQFSVSTLRLDNLEQLRSRLSASVFTESIRTLIAALAGLARDSDVLSRVADNELYLLLPETDRFGVMMFERRVIDTVRALDERSADARPAIALTVGSATYPRDGQDFDELLHRCRQRMEETRHTLRRRLQLQELDFWQSLSALLGPWPARLERQTGTGGVSSASYRGPLSEDHFARVQREIGRELARDPRSRGLLYVGTGDADPHFPLLEFLPPDLAARICLLVRRGQARLDHPAVTTVFLQGLSPTRTPVGQHEFLLFLSEASAYAYARRGHEPTAFHTSDRPLVDHLISRLQQAYDLQPY